MSASNRTQLTSAPFVSFEEQHRRRRAGVPTVSVLVGPAGLAAACWRQWCAALGRPVAQQSRADLAGLVKRWATMLAERRDLTADAANWIASRMGRPHADFSAALAVKTVHDIEVFCDSVAFDNNSGAELAVCRRLLTWRAAGISVTPENLADQLDKVLSGQDSSGFRVVAALASLTPEETWPAVLLAPHELRDDRVDWIDGAARLLTALATHAPRIPASFVAEAPDLDRYLRTARESHATALVREGFVTVGSLTETEVAERLGAVGAAVKLSRSISRLTADGASVELVDDFRRAAAAAGGDGARSEAERFLYARLESLAATVGLFVLNAELDFSFGRGKAEVDFLAPGLRMVVEVDGWFHFQDPEAYRRDRRKDWELQRRGYVVLRFLAEDIVPRLEEVLDAILTAVAWRREAGREKER